MTYDEDLLVELIAGGDVSQTEIAERVGVSRRTVWRIANGHSRPDLQRKIADTVEGYRQAAIRLATKFMTPLLKKQIEVALEGNGEISRRCREFLLKTFMIVLPQQAAKRKPRRAGDRRHDPVAPGMNLMELSPDLKDRIVKELGGPDEERSLITETTESTEDTRLRRGFGGQTEVEEATVSPSPLPSGPELVEGASPVAGSQLPGATPPDKSGGDPFAIWVDGPHGKKVYAHSIRAIEEAKAEEDARPTRRRIPRVPLE
jgi:DNA-binding XRE family transcriptional regulator